MPDLDLIKQGEQGVRDRRGRFARLPRRCRPHCPVVMRTGRRPFRHPVRLQPTSLSRGESGGPGAQRDVPAAPLLSPGTGSGSPLSRG